MSKYLVSLTRPCYEYADHPVEAEDEAAAIVQARADDAAGRVRWRDGETGPISDVDVTEETPAPAGYRKRDGISLDGGCGRPDCTDCYERMEP